MGGCVKGYAVDQAVKELDKNFKNFLVNAGGDIFARGKFQEKKWSVGVANPENEEENIFLIEISDEALATSGSYRRKWKIGNESYHHIVSGNTNTNISTTLSSVTVQASSCMVADSFATICFLLGEEKGRKFLVENNAMGYFY